jgi:hypothetical protein
MVKITEGRIRVATSDVAELPGVSAADAAGISEGMGGAVAAAGVRRRVPGAGPARGVHDKGAQAVPADGVDVVDVSRRRTTAEAMRGGPGIRVSGTLTAGGPGRRCSGDRISWCGRTCCPRWMGSRGRAGSTMRSWTPGWPGRRRPGPYCRPRGTALTPVDVA